MQALGYTTETMQFMLVPLVTSGKDPIGSMGDDAALACLSDQPRMLYDYFKQLFAQVTNPSIDSIREEVIMSLECFVGPEGNVLDATPAAVPPPARAAPDPDERGTGGPASTSITAAGRPRRSTPPTRGPRAATA